MDTETKEAIELMTSKLTEALKPQSEFELFEDNKMVTETNKFVMRPDEKTEIKDFAVFPTQTFIDDLFLSHDQKPLGGLPFGIQLGVTGLPDVGKSILIQEVIVRACSNGKRVLFVSSEDVWRGNNSRFDLESRMKEKAKIMGVDWKLVVDNLFILDTVVFNELSDWSTLASAYRQVCEREKIDLVVVDSVTLLDNYRGALKYRLSELCKYNQKYGITGIYVNQRASDEWDDFSMAGGIGIAHGLDATLIIDYGKVWMNNLIKQDLGIKQGEFVRIARLTGCRLCHANKNYQAIEVTSDGFVKVVKTTSEESHSGADSEG